ncbi:MAG: hemolysin family protein [Gammaproteobacteria bacterium]|nr:hemolysin family protein [Gammaproteobacteria bacterium]
MLILIIYIATAVGVSFLCSILEAVLLSVNTAFIEVKKSEGKPSGEILDRLKAKIGEPLAAILTLNTIAHTIGAAGAGAQATIVFGSAYLGIFSAILTLLILIFSEIIPKTLGTQYWKQLAPFTAHTLKYMLVILKPFVKLSLFVTKGFTKHGDQVSSGMSREEFAVMADLSSKEGELEIQESHFMKNMLLMQNTLVCDAMTPRTVIFSLASDLSINEFFHKYDKTPFSRIPVYEGESDNITGYVLKSDLFLAQARGNSDKTLKEYCHSIPVIIETMKLKDALNDFLTQRTHIMLAVDEYGTIEGILTLEDVIETLLGFEIIDEKDMTVDMQEEARKLWKKRIKDKGLSI